MTWPPLPPDRRALALDGGLATELERAGASLRDPLWSAKVLVEQPSVVRKVHGAYLAAGADVITTATYQATIEGLARHGLAAKDAEAVLRRGVTLVREAWADFLETWHQRDRQDETGPEEPRAAPLIAASIGPYGAFLHDGSEYTGDYHISERELSRFHEARIEILADSGADVIAAETIPSRREAEVIVNLLERHGKASAWISFTSGDDHRIADGTPFAECVASLESSERVVATGINCSAPETAARLLEAAAPIASKSFVVYPNSGELYSARTGDWHGTAAIGWIDRVLERYLTAGARVVGGCCRTTPADIRAIRERLS